MNIFPGIPGGDDESWQPEPSWQLLDERLFNTIRALVLKTPYLDTHPAIARLVKALARLECVAPVTSDKNNVVFVALKCPAGITLFKELSEAAQLSQGQISFTPDAPTMMLSLQVTHYHTRELYVGVLTRVVNSIAHRYYQKPLRL